MTQPTPELTEAYFGACLRARQVHEAIEVAKEMHKRVMAEMREELDALEDECARLEREIGL